jgi:hypothetical protein
MVIVLFFVLVNDRFFQCFGGKLPAKTHPIEIKTPLPEVGEHVLTIVAFRQRKGLGMNETRMAIKLIF